MAIQAQKMYTNTSGFEPDDWAGGGGGVGMTRDEMCVNLQRQQQQQQQNQYQAAAAADTFSQSLGLGSIVEKQSLEIDHCIRSQSERLRLVLREQRKREVTELLKKIGAGTNVLLKQKDEEIARAANRTSQLQSLILKAQSEAQMWQNIARRNELRVVNLRNSIQMLHHSGALYGGVQGGLAVVEDSESCCDESREEVAQLVCRMCQTRERSVVLLPCRHLCCCTVCVSMIEFCPICQTEKKATIEALLR